MLNKPISVIPVYLLAAGYLLRVTRYTSTDPTAILSRRAISLIICQYQKLKPLLVLYLYHSMKLTDYIKYATQLYKSHQPLFLLHLDNKDNYKYGKHFTLTLSLLRLQLVKQQPQVRLGRPRLRFHRRLHHHRYSPDCDTHQRGTHLCFYIIRM